ncbi:nitrile hydratase accessory protein [Ruixingdingia sedimenti]|uniref:Nitrile hydratase accessory protein n=1 Tax=Ruixingdingia sedimenti TaxID=3073604 RepID=A0ABU1FCH9_9RHOB|nr:nitrile hydratase accessory protein [Xinfangfangia sp. LG-4]MDR5654569.1 nitrile hydratase accessory protein [Xinfangfangia sp. LG-4]
MSQPIDKERQPDIGALGRIPQDDEGPVFNAPWEASAFAIAVRLSEAGHFTWGEWVDAFSRQIKDFEAKGIYDPATDDGHHYYEIWVATLEKLIVGKGIFDGAALDARHQHLIDNPVPHDHEARRDPIFIG